MQVDRFTFQNNTIVFVELASKEEAGRIVEQWGNGTSQSEGLRVRAIKDDFHWGETDMGNQTTPFRSRYIIAQGSAPRDVLRALEESRRMMLSVQTPGWSPNTAVSVAKEEALRIIGRLFSKYRLEGISDISPFYGDRQQRPRMLCVVDFETKEDADNAAREIDDTEVEGRLTWLRPYEASAWRTHQYAKFEPEYVAELQEKGVLTKETYDDKFNTPLPKDKKKKKKTSKQAIEKEQGGAPGSV